MRRSLPTLFALLLATIAHAADKPPLPKVPDGFSVELVLQAPDIEAPTALAVAPNGDVFVAEDPMDMRGPATKNIDKVWCLKGGDPKKKVLVAENMWAVMGLEVVRDKLYCVHPPYVTVFTLGDDGKPTKREELFTDLGPKVAGLPGFNDHVPSGIRMGMDGWLYVSIGDKGIPRMTRKEADGGSVHVAEGRERRTKEGNHISLEGGGVIRFRPDGSGLEVYASGTRNHLDVPLDEQDRVFVRDNTDDGLGWNTRLMYLPPGGFLGYPWAYKLRPAETLPALADYGGGSPCGGWVYADDGLPETYRGRVFHAEWGKGKVYAVKLTPEGAGFKAADEIKFMDPEGTGVQNFRPFTLRPTHDGTGFYVTDWAYSGWSNPAVAGRLWKVTYTKGDVKPKPRGTDKDEDAKLIDALDHPAHSERLRAQRELAARGWMPGVARATTKLTERQRAHLAWVYPNIGGLTQPEASVRREAVRSNVGRTLTQDEAGRFYTRLAEMVQTDPDPGVRMAVADALGRLTGAPVEVLRRLEKEDDLWVRHTLVRAAKRAGLKGDVPEQEAFDALVKEPGPGRAAAFAVLADEYTPQAVKYLAGYAKHDNSDIRKAALAVLARNAKDRPAYAGNWWGTQPNRAGPPKRTVAWEGTPACRDAILAAVHHVDWGTRQAAVAALATVGEASALDPLTKRFGVEKEPPVRAEIVRTVAALATPEAGKFLADIAREGDHAVELRVEAVAGLERAKDVPALASLLGDKMNEAVQVRALEAFARLPATTACPNVVHAIHSERPAVRRAAALALAACKDAKAGRQLLPLLADADAGVRSAAVQTLGTLQIREAIPNLLPLAGVEATQFDAVTALAKMPDVRAVSAYLAGMASKSPELRTASRTALITIRDQAAPVLEELAKRRELPAGALPELRAVYAGAAPVVKWKVVGPFPKDTKAVEADKVPDFTAALTGKGAAEVRWRDVSADAAAGRINLAAMYKGATDAAAYAFAEVESATDRDAELALGSDDGVTVWLNGKQVHQWVGNRGWSAASDRVTVKLTKGVNRLLVRCYNDGGPWDMSAAVSGDGSGYGFLKGAGEKLDLAAYREFARKNKGDAERGGRLYADLKGLACVKCHAVGGTGGAVGPSLDGVGLKYGREDLMTSILEPSKTIAQGYETIRVVTTAGKQLVGVFKGETGDAVSLADAEGKTISVPKMDIDERAFSPLSTMPNGLNEGMTLQDFADVVAYLEARKEQTPPKK